MRRENLTKAEILTDHFELIKNYWLDQETGDFFKVTKAGEKKLMKLGFNHNGYLRITVNGQRHLAHRVVWFFVHGYWPVELDHIDHNKANNAMSNLRIVDRVENSRNSSLSTRNKSGYTGVSFDSWSKKWRACVTIGGKNIKLGRFDDPESAYKARIAASIKHGFHANHGMRSGGANGQG